ncbi:YeiH family protein [Coralloluteibacterium stylophorae]|uniref:Sulfate exporter family transporter n=1 Tax=Coralloluteibacterium stylophorae TaxID=1776034 RepID=A0A8J7VSU9_9GAMM|nr:putative sulfate exporter family transporter [Coralloluteibacterium stylophorae]MBS7455539.1 putative sulfate exporter family transporter [Coralloluteibacterium stylophorae]
MSASAPVAADPPAPPRWPGLALASAVALVALGLGHLFPLVGGPVFGILLGIAVATLRRANAALRPGIAFAARNVLQWAIVALGLNVGLGQVARTGLDSLSVTLVTTTAAFAAALLLGRLLRVPNMLVALIGIGTAICGGSAIAAVAPILRPDEHETAYALSTIFLFNLAAVLLFPALGHLLDLSQLGFGLWAGTAINDTSSVVAAAYGYGARAGDHATIVKLTRATLIVPVCLVAAGVMAWRQRRAGGGGFRLSRVVPWFIVWFVAASALRSLGLVPAAWTPGIHLLAEVLIVIGLTAVGLSSDLRRMAAAGHRPILLGLGTWVAVAASGLAVQFATGQI